MTPAELQPRLAQPYDRLGWLGTLRKVAPGTETFASPQQVAPDGTRAEAIVQLGKIHLAADRRLALLEVTVGERVDLLRNRVGLRQIVARYIDQAEYHGVLAIFHQRAAKDYRFTFDAREGAFNEAGQVHVNVDPQAVALPEPKVVVDGSPSGKVCRQVAPLATGLEDVEDSVEQLPKRMFARSARFVGLGETEIDESPFRVAKVRCVSHRQRVTGCGTMYKLSLKIF